jgi:hypothetical protein
VFDRSTVASASSPRRPIPPGIDAGAPASIIALPNDGALGDIAATERRVRVRGYRKVHSTERPIRERDPW